MTLDHCVHKQQYNGMTCIEDILATLPVGDVRTNPSKMNFEGVQDAMTETTCLFGNGDMSSNTYRVLNSALVNSIIRMRPGNQDTGMDDSMSLSQNQPFCETPLYNETAGVLAVDQTPTHAPPLEDVFADILVHSNLEPMENNDDTVNVKNKTGKTSKGKKQRKQDQKASAPENGTQETAWPFQDAAEMEGIETTTRDESRHIVLLCVTCRLPWAVRFKFGKEHPIMSLCSSKNVGALTICPDCRMETLLDSNEVFDHSSRPFTAVTRNWSSLFDTSMMERIRASLGHGVTVFASKEKVLFFEANGMASMEYEYGAKIWEIGATA